MIYSDNRWIGNHGIGRYAREVLARLPFVKPITMESPPLSPLDPILLKIYLQRQGAGAFYSPGFNAPILPKIPCILTLHDLIHLEDPQQASSAKKIYYEFVLKPVVRRAPFVFTVSEVSQLKIANWAGVSTEKIVVTPNGISPTFKVDTGLSKTNEKFFIYVGSSKPHKNTERMLRAFASSRLTEFSLKWVGQISEGDIALIEKLNIQHQIQHYPNISDEELQTLYSVSSGNLFPSLIEGFGLPPLECILSGKPALISSSNPLLKDISSLTEVIDPLSVEDIAGGMRRLASKSISDTRSVELVSALRTKYNWDQTAKIVSAKLQTLI